MQQANFNSNTQKKKKKKQQQQQINLFYLIKKIKTGLHLMESNLCKVAAKNDQTDSIGQNSLVKKKNERKEQQKAKWLKFN